MATKDIGQLRTRLSWEDEGANKSLEGFRRDLRGLRSEMNLAKSGGKDYANSLKGLSQQSDILTRRFRTQEERVKELRRRYDESVKVKGDDAVATQNLQSQLNNATAEMNRTEQQLERLNEEIRRMESPWTQLGTSLTNTGEKFQKFGKQATDFGKSYSLRVTAPIVAGGTAVFKASMDYESAFAGVRKTVDATEEEFQQLSDGIRNMAKELPASATEIAAVGEAAGQLGIETENILSFTRTMIDLGEATNMTAEQASTEFARFANIVGMSQKDFDRLGSVVVDLGNNLATTEAEIVNMAMRLAGAGAQIGLTEAEIMSFSGALSSVGIEAEAGGSAFSKVMVNMQLAAERGGDELKAFADVAGMSADDFKKAFEDDAAGAIVSFVEGLAKVEEQGDTAIGVLDEMGITEVRMRDALLRAAGASDVFTDSIEMGTKAWEENTALTEEAEQRYATTESQLKMLWNRVKDVAITLGDALIPAVMDAIDAAEPFIQKIEDGAQAFSDMDEEQQQAILKMIALVAAIGPASVAIGGLSTGVGTLLTGAGKLATGLGAAGGTGLIGKIGLLASGPALPVGLAIAGVGALAGGIYLLTRDTEKLHDISTETAEGLLDQAGTLEELANRYDELYGKTNLTNEEFARYVDLQTEMEKATDPDTIYALHQEMDYLREKSGLSNDELNEMIGLNNDIIEQSPTVERTFTDKGNAIIDSTDAVREYIDSLRDMAVIELEAERVKALENEAALRRENREIGEEIREIETDIQRILDMRKMPLEDVRSRIEEIQGMQYDTNRSAEEMNELQRELTTLLDIESGKIVESLEHMQEQRNELIEKRNLNDEEIEKLDRINDQLEAAYLQNVGINDEKAQQAAHEGKSLDVLDEQLDNLRDQKIELQNITPVSEQNTDEYRAAVGEIDNQIGKLQTAKRNIEGLTSEAENYTSELARDVEKTVNTKMNPSIDSLNRDLTSPLTRFINLRTRGVGLPMPGYADGTNYHKGGPAFLGEEGPELIRKGNNWGMAGFGLYDLPRGYQVFTHEESKRIAGAFNNISGYAAGTNMGAETNRIVSGLNNQQSLNDSNGQVVSLLSDIVQAIRDGQVIQIDGKNITAVVNENNALKEVGSYI